MFLCVRSTSMVTIGKWLVICFGAASGNGGAVNTCSLFDTTAGPNGAWVAPIIVGPQGFPPPRSASRMVVYGNNQVLAFGGGTFDVANDYTYDDAWTFGKVFRVFDNGSAKCDGPKSDFTYQLPW